MAKITYEYPIRWPVGWPRSEKRRPAKYKVTLSRAMQELEAELLRFGATDAQVSTDIPLRRDGRPYGDGDPANPSVAVYWTRKEVPHVIACDCWSSVRSNVRAVGLAVESLRSLERCGASEVLERAYAGFAALPPGGPRSAPTRSWREVLGLGEFSGPPFAMRAGIEAAYKSLALKLHPDVGGSHEAMVELAAAREAALKEVDGT